MTPPPNPHAAWLDLLDRTFTRWPDMRRYEKTARAETINVWRDGKTVTIKVVTVTIFDKQQEE